MTATADKAVADLQRANADLQRRLDEALAERDEALEQQTAAAEVLGVINSSPGDLTPVFEAMLEKALRLCSATSGQMTRFDGQRFHVLIASSAGQRADGVTFEPVVPDPGSVLEQIVGGEDIVHIPDI